MSAHEAGRELDALIAEKVMGWTDVDWSNGYYAVATDPTTRIRQGVPSYSTDVAAAWLVLEMFQCTVVIQRALSPDARDVGYRVTIPDMTHSGKPGTPWRAVVNVDADTAPLVICRAALAAIEVPA